MHSESHVENPFKGLRPYQMEDQYKLFGRDRDLILMKDRIFSSRTTLLFAGSGVGKTSFLNAKVIPSLKQQYCVIWHNRWTGADERYNEDIWDDRSHRKFWPPQAFADWLKEVLMDRISRRPETSKPQADYSASKIVDDDDMLRAEVHRVISQSLREGAAEERLSHVLSRFRKTAREQDLPGTNQKNCILILDQFEEVFQYHAFEKYFKDFISDVCQVINNEDYQVRFIFSLREEFLGELSIFDNRIPDLFNNYYRLRYPEKDEARDIIVQTCQLAEVQPDPGKLDLLVEDLAKIEKGFPESRHNSSATTERFLHRNFVPPPYLQIVCDRLWKEQFEDPAPPHAQTNGDVKLSGKASFLQNYRSDSVDEVDESDAQRTVRTFCQEKLSAPFLTKREQRLAARSFDFLVTRQGAKMAYELNNLARHMDEEVWPLKRTLQKLSDPEVRILRESRGPERSYWFELYHDMYAGIVERWKRNFQRETRRRNRIRYAAYLGTIAALILIPLAWFYWLKWPSDYQKVLIDYRKNLNVTDLRQGEGFGQVVVAYSQLRDTPGYSEKARGLWAEIWQRRAQLFEANEKRDEALICLLQAAALAKGLPAEKEYIAQANNLFGEDEEWIKATYCSHCKSVNISSDGRHTVVVTDDGTVKIWSTTRPDAPVFVPCFDCDQALITNDSQNVVAVSPKVLVESGTPIAGQTDNKRPVAERGDGPQQLYLRLPNSTAQPSGTPKGDIVIGWDLIVSDINSDPFLRYQSFRIKNPRQSTDSVTRFHLKAVNNTPFGLLVAAVLNGQLTIWREDGSIFVESVPVSRRHTHEDLLELDAYFSPDGRFFAVGGMEARLWEITARGLSPPKTITGLSNGSIIVFSPDARYCLTATAGKVELWELANQKRVFTRNFDFLEMNRIGFTADSEKFFMAFRDGSATLCESNTRQCVNKQPKLRSGFSKFDLEGKHILLSRDDVFEKWSLETGERVGQLQKKEVEVAEVLSDGSLAIKSGPFIRLWDVPARKTDNIFAIDNDDLLFDDLSADGETMLGSTPDIRGGPVTSSIWDVPKKNRLATLDAQSNPQNYAISPDGRYVAGASRPDKTAEIFVVNKPYSSKVFSFDDNIEAYAFSLDSKLLAVATEAGDISLIDTATYQIIKSFKSASRIEWIMFARSSNYLLVVTANPQIKLQSNEYVIPALEVWSVSTGERLALNVDQNEPIRVFHTSRTDRLLIIQNSNLFIFDLANGVKLRDQVYVPDVAFGVFSADGKWIALGDTKGNLGLYAVETGKQSRPVTIGSPVRRIFFADDNKSFVAVTDLWLHQIAIGEELSYSNGIFTASILRESVRQFYSAEPAVSYFRWFRYRNRILETREASFDGKFSKPVLQGDPYALLETWSDRLGFAVDSIEMLSRRW